MTKRHAREIALHLLFEKEFKKEWDLNEVFTKRFNGEIFTQCDDFEFYGTKIPEVLSKYIREVVSGFIQNLDEIDENISKFSKEWDISRISRLNKSILRLSICEIKFMDDIPVSASINEAVELCKIYDADDSSKFINGILGSYARSINE